MATLIFDGDCGFCTTSANWIVAHSKVEIQAIPYQWANLAEFGLTQAEAAAKVQLVHAGNTYAGHECMAKLLLVQGTVVTKLLGAVMLMPIVEGVSALVYDLVAKNRHKLPGGTPACKLPKKD